jgi:rhodanese-related sulfurtransferase
MSTGPNTCASTSNDGSIAPCARVELVSSAVVREWLDANEAVVVDVREAFEFATEHIAGAINRPLAALDVAQVQAASASRRVVFCCRTGRRSKQATLQVQAQGDTAFHLDGGLEAWKASGLQTERSAGAPRIDIIGQVHIAAGLLIVLGTAMGAFVSPWFLLLSGFVGGGLMFAGTTSWCPMAMLLGKMPWNRCGSSCST